MSKQKIILLLVAVAIIVAGIWYFLSNSSQILPNGSNSVVATVNGEELKYKEFNNQLTQIRQNLLAQDPNFDDSNLKNQVLDQMVTNILLKQEAQKANLTVSDAEIETEYNNLVTNLGGEEVLKEELANLDLSETELKTNIENQILVNKYIDSQIESDDIVVTEAEVLALYEEANSVQELPPIEEIEAEIRAELTRQKRDALISDLIAGLNSTADIEVLI